MPHATKAEADAARAVRELDTARAVLADLKEEAEACKIAHLRAVERADEIHSEACRASDDAFTLEDKRAEAEGRYFEAASGCRFTDETDPADIYPCHACGGSFFHRPGCPNVHETCNLPGVKTETRPAPELPPVWGVAWTDAGPDRGSRLRCEGCHRCVYYTHASAFTARTMMLEHLEECPEAAALEAEECDE